MSSTLEIKDMTPPVANNEVISSVCSNTKIGSLLTCYARNEVIWVGGSNGQLFKSIDGGNNWIDQSRTSATDEFYTSIQYPENNLVGFMSNTNNKVYKSINGGTDYTVIYTLDTVSYGLIRRTEMYDNLNGILGTSKGYIFYTTNGGVDWIPSTIINNGYSWTQLDSVLCIEYTNSNVIHISCDYGKILRSVNSGQSFTIHQPDATYGNQLYGISFLDENTGITTARDGYYYLTFNACVTWEKYVCVEQMTLNQFRYIKYIDAHNIIGFKANGHIVKSDYWGRDFVSIFSGSCSYNRASIISKDKFFGCGQDNSVNPPIGSYDCNINYEEPILNQYDWVDYTDYISEIGTINKAQESDIIGEVGVNVMENTSIDLIYKGLVKTWFDAIDYEAIYALRIKYYGNIVFEGVIDTSTISINRKEYTLSFEAVDKISALDMIELPLQRAYRKIDSINLSSPVKGDVHVKCYKDSVTRYEVIIEPKYYDGSAWVEYPEILSVRSDSIKSKNGITISFTKTVDGEVTTMNLIGKFVRWSAPWGLYYLLQSEQDWFIPSVVSPNTDIPESPSFCDNTYGYECYIYDEKFLGEDINVNWVEYQTNALGGYKCFVDRASETLWSLYYEEYNAVTEEWDSVTYSSTSEYYLRNGMYITMPTQDGKTYCKGKVKNVSVVGSTFYFGLDDVYGIYPYDPINDIYPLISSDKTILVEKADNVYTITVNGSNVEYNYGVKSFDWTKMLYALVKTIFTEITTIEIGLLDRTFDLYYYTELYKDNAILGKSALDAIKFLLDANNCTMYIKNNTLILKKRQDVTADATTYTIDDSANNTNLLKLIENAFWEKAVDGVELTVESRLRRNDGSYVDTTYTKTKYAVDTIEPKNKKTLTMPYQRFFVGAVGDEEDIINELNIYALVPTVFCWGCW